MKNFVKMTKLTAKSGGIKGRADYISNKDRQENLIYHSEPIDWTPYVAFEKTKNNSLNEGRELIIALPNIWDKLSADELQKKTKELAELSIQKNTDYQYAIHYNSSKTNLHMHIVFSERSMTGEVKYYDRDIYHTEKGKIARKKSDRAKDEFGNELPPVHKKGELQNSGFSAKDKIYKDYHWLDNTKDRIADFYKSQGIDITEPKIFELHQYHEGKGSESETIKQKNEFIKTANEYLLLSEKKGVPGEQLLKQKKSFIRDIVSNTIEDLKAKFNRIKETLLNSDRAEKNDSTVSDLSNDKDTFVPFGRDELEVYDLYQEKALLQKDYKNISRQISDKNIIKSRVENIVNDHFSKDYYNEYQELKGSLLGSIKAKKYYEEHKDYIDMYQEALNENMDWTSHNQEVRILHDQENEIRKNEKLIDERVKQIAFESDYPIRIEEKDVLSGKSLEEIEKSLKSKNKPLEFVKSPERRPEPQKTKIKDEGLEI